MNFTLRFAIWTVVWGGIGYFVGDNLELGSMKGSWMVTFVTVAGAIVGVIGAVTQEIASTLRDRK